jgi:hypothetical protein
MVLSVGLESSSLSAARVAGEAATPSSAKALDEAARGVACVRRLPEAVVATPSRPDGEE